MTEAAKNGRNKRRHERTKTKLLGRYMLADRREAKCTVIDVSMGGVAIAAPERGAVGETVVVYIDRIGRVEGKVVRHLEEGFALQLDASSRVMERIAHRLADLQHGGTLSPSPERRGEARIKAADIPTPESSGKSGYQVLDVSFTGADVKITGHRPAIGTILQVGKMRGRVVRYTEVGVAVEFIDPAPAKTLSERLTQLRSS
jgi:hypothetical protein